MVRFLRGVAAALVMLALSQPAHAEDKAKARAAYNQATQHYDLGEFEQALDGFKEAYRNYEDPAFLFNIAQCHRALGHKKDAVISYRSYLRKSPQAANRGEVQKTIEELEHAIADDDAKAAAAAKPGPPPPAATAPPGPAPASTSTTPPANAPATNAPAATAEPPAPAAAPPAPSKSSSASPSSSTSLSTTAPAPEKHRSRAWIWGVVGGVAAVALGVGLGVGLGLQSHAPQPSYGAVRF